jgi:hypothetical protein
VKNPFVRASIGTSKLEVGGKCQGSPLRERGARLFEGDGAPVRRPERRGGTKIFDVDC